MVYKVVNGAIPSGAQWMENSIVALKGNGRNLVRELQDRAVDLSSDGGEFGEAYVDSNGRLNSVIIPTSSTTASFDPTTNTYTGKNAWLEGTVTDNYKAISSGTQSDMYVDSTTAYSLTLDYSDVDPIGAYVQTIYTSPKYIGTVNFKIYGYVNGTASTGTMTYYIETYNGSTWDTWVSGNLNRLTVESTVSINANVQGLRIRASTSAGTVTGYNMTTNIFYCTTSVSGEGEIVHTIPNNLLSRTISSSFLTVLSKEWEEGSNVQYKLKNTAVTNWGTYVTISASSVSNYGDFTTGNCDARKIDSGDWVVFCYTGVAEDERAELYKLLFYDEKINNFSNITNIGTSVTRDIGKQFTKIQMAVGGAGTITYTGHNKYNGVFSNTTTNTDFSYWSAMNTRSYDGGKTYIELPEGNTVKESFGAGLPSYNELGTDTSADEVDNPATIEIRIEDNTSGELVNASINVLVLAKGAIAWTLTDGLEGGTDELNEVTEFSEILADYTGIPTFNISDSGWLDFNSMQTFTAFSSEPDQLVVKLIPRSSDPSIGIPSIKGVAIFE